MTCASSGLISSSVSAHSMPYSVFSGFEALNSAALSRSSDGTLKPPRPTAVGIGLEVGIGVENSKRSPTAVASSLSVVMPIY